MTTVQFTSPAAERLTAYIELRRSLGFDLRSQECILGKFDRLLAREMAAPCPITREHVESFLRSLAGLATLTRRMQLSNVRQFLIYLKQFEPLTFIPDKAMEPAHSSPRAPHIYSEEEIRKILDGLLRYGAGPIGPLRSRAYCTLIALLSATGLRVSEALALRLGDLDWRQALLHVRKTKFHKARMVPLAPSTCAGLKRFLTMRAEHGHATTPDAFIFVADRARPFAYGTANRVFNIAARQAGLRGPPGTRGPRIHDLRHTHAVRCLLGWYRAGKDVQALVPVLATYLGHSRVSGTDVYLTATSELLEQASERLDRHLRSVPSANGGPTR
ncbi:MAG: tyrosine-type recombinase/integrase [Armatimonadetes bacterium]|nr:tyrosine-type recombinase/integrase [Armatimonadota bacterium]